MDYVPDQGHEKNHCSESAEQPFDSLHDRVVDDSTHSLGNESRHKEKPRVQLTFNFEPIPLATSSSLSASPDFLGYPPMSSSPSVDPHYMPDFRRNPQFSDLNYGDMDSLNSYFPYDNDHFFSGETYQSPRFFNSIYSRSFASSPTFSDSLVGHHEFLSDLDRHSFGFHSDELPAAVTPTLSTPRPPRTSPSKRPRQSHSSRNSPQRGKGSPQVPRARGGSPGSVEVGNEVNLEAVASGKDRRTTLMIKNIPNAFSRETILANIDRCCRNKYDFFYLPIDQKTNCNLGYGYINMIDLDSVCTMYREFHGKRWSNTRSVKVCTICYGRLQSGNENLVEYCSDWSVMTSDEKYHPLFFKPVKSIVDGKEVVNMERYSPKISLSMKNSS